jgi:hypothetical protein
VEETAEVGEPPEGTEEAVVTSGASRELSQWRMTRIERCTTAAHHRNADITDAVWPSPLR